MSEEKVCCICNEHKKFLARINAGQKLYCMQCQAKITKEYGMDYWKPCSFVDFLENMNRDKPPRPYSETPMADGLRRAYTKLGLDVTKKTPRKKKRKNVK